MGCLISQVFDNAHVSELLCLSETLLQWISPEGTRLLFNGLTNHTCKISILPGPGGWESLKDQIKPTQFSRSNTTSHDVDACFKHHLSIP